MFGCIKALGVDPELVRAFAFCEGPGSVLGVRSVAMALRVWQALAPRPIFAYGSLAIVSHAIGQSDVGVIADARRDRWHHYSLHEGLGLRATGELSGNLVIPDGFRHWSALPANVRRVPYLLGELLPRIPDAALFHETDAPDAYLAAEPSYATWTPHIHRAPMTTT